jgi:hypothetical protein
MAEWHAPLEAEKDFRKKQDAVAELRPASFEPNRTSYRHTMTGGLQFPVPAHRHQALFGLVALSF